MAKRPSSITITNDNPLNYAFDGGLIPGGASPLDDTPESIEFEAGDDDHGQDGDQSSESDSEIKRMPEQDLAASLRVFSESIVKLDMAELKMIKERERLRFEAEKRRMEVEIQLTQMMMQTHLQIASLVCQKSSNRKRKRLEDAKFGVSQRDGAILMGLLSSSFISGLDPMK